MSNQEVNPKDSIPLPPRFNKVNLEIAIDRDILLVRGSKVTEEAVRQLLLEINQSVAKLCGVPYDHISTDTEIFSSFLDGLTLKVNTKVEEPPVGQR